MKRQRLTVILISLVSCILITGVIAASATDSWVSARNDELLSSVGEPIERLFRRVIIGDKIVYFYKRTINGAIVEKDFIVYQFDRDTKALINKKVHWRDEIPEPPMYEFPVIAKKEAEGMVDGEIVSSQLYIISPESDIFPIEPTPTNPCWVVTSIQEGHTIIIIIDAVTGERLGYGIAPPQVTGFSFTGPGSNNPCSGGWTAWYTNARDWFETIGYPTEDIYWPTKAKIENHIRSDETAVFYEIAHGGYTSFASGCIGGTVYEITAATEVKNWITDYEKMPFTFIASCDGMCSTNPGTFSYEFRKGSNDGTATIGYCGMSHSQCWNPGTCWSLSLDWQTALFMYMSYGWSLEEAYNQAMADYPECFEPDGYGSCMRFAGDPDFTLVPIVHRTPAICNGQKATIIGTAGHDVIEGTAGPDIIHGLGGHDVIYGMGGDDVICGGEGADHITGHAGNDYLSGGKGHDVLIGCSGDDELWGNWGNDTLIGGDGADVLWGGIGPSGGTQNNNDTCYDTLGSFIRGCEVFYEQ